MYYSMSKLYNNIIGVARIRAALLPFGYDAPPEMSQRIRDYIALLLKWNDKVNLTTITSPADILTRHFGESLFALPFIPTGARTLLDIGSGAGFPGLVLKMARPDLEVTLMEPVLKKSAFLKEAARNVDCAITVNSVRTENVDPAGGAYDCITARAIRLDAAAIRWIELALSPRGVLIAWVGAADTTAIRAQLGFEWNEAKIPASESRVLLIGRRRS